MSHGGDPIFRNNDGSNCEGALPQTMDESRAAYSLLLTRGLIRVALDVPAGGEFVIESVDDPNHCGPSGTDASLYRRPLPSTNLKFISAVMWDGRESTPSSTIAQDLLRQANDATRGHAAAGIDITAAQARQIVAFETGLFTAQERDNDAGNLHAAGARGGAAAVRDQEFFLGINDPVGLNRPARRSMRRRSRSSTPGAAWPDRRGRRRGTRARQSRAARPSSTRNRSRCRASAVSTGRRSRTA